MDFTMALGLLIGEYADEGEEAILEALDHYITLVSEKQDAGNRNLSGSLAQT